MEAHLWAARGGGRLRSQTAMATEIDVRRVEDLTDRENAEYARVRARIDYGEVLGYEFSSEREWRVLVRVDGALASHVGIGRRRVTVGGQELEVGAVGGVWTAPELRGRGLAGQAMEAATRFLCEEVEVAAGLLICREHVASFYESVGWARVSGPVRFDQPTGQVGWDRPVLVWLCRLGAWPDGVIDLAGLPW
jgi:predicted GNAT family N-acyltransferase